IVPKVWVNDDGSLGETNDVVCTGIEEKLGIHANSTASISLGSKGKCRGLLLGDANKGMRAMFLMMNDARLMVANQGLGCASAAYLYALNYARQRVQGRHLMKMLDKEAPSVPIIQHPDVRRMLMLMKVYVEAMRSLSYYLAFCFDQIATTTDSEEKTRLQGIVDFLIPIAKAYSSERAFDVCNLAVQVYGGYGYSREFPVEQLLRDCRITSIYEGTNGIQAMDLLGRKLGQNGGRPIIDLGEEIRRCLALASENDRTAAIAQRYEEALVKLEEVARHMGMTAMYGNLMTAAAHAHPFLEVCGDIVTGWMLLWRARTAADALNNGFAKKDQAFYEGQVQSAEFHSRVMLPVTLGKMESILAGSGVAVEICDESFGGK
ncbi:MAG: acyl-CoA dehydrogenase, partial [Thermoanaerobaculia bacterium]